MFSGKTHTMLGTEEDPGMIPRVIHTLFQNLATTATAESTTNAADSDTHRVTFSYLEIYNEKVCQAVIAIIQGFFLSVCNIVFY